MKTLSVLFLEALITVAGLAGVTNRLSFPAAGFSIATLDSPHSANARQVVAMLLPPVDDFAGNVNVRIQPHSGSLDDYVALSLRQFEEQKVAVIEHKNLSQTAVTFECKGKTQGRTLHWYARAELSNGHIYLATATALEARWAEESSVLKACIDSLRCDSNQVIEGK